MRCAGCIIAVVLLLGLYGCGGPAWYVARDVGGSEHLLVGYGEGESMAEARADAAREIAEAIGVRVHSTGEVVSEQGPEGGVVSSRFRVELSSLATLRELVTVRLSRVSGRYYMALAYDNRTLFQKVEAALGQSEKPDANRGRGYADNLPLYRKLARFGVSSADARLVRRHGRWDLIIQDRTFLLKKDDWFRLCFVEKPEKEGLKLEVSPSGPLATGTRYQVHLTTPMALGFLSLYHVSESGQTLALITNRAVDGLTPVTFPDERLYSGLEAIATGSNINRDMLLATWTPAPLPATVSHPPISETLLPETDERTLSYGELMEHLGDAIWASRFVWITR